MALTDVESSIADSHTTPIMLPPYTPSGTYELHDYTSLGNEPHQYESDSEHEAFHDSFYDLPSLYGKLPDLKDIPAAEEFFSITHHPSPNDSRNLTTYSIDDLEVFEQFLGTTWSRSGIMWRLFTI